MGNLIFISLFSSQLRSESKALTWTFLVSSCIQPAYLIVLFIRVSLPLSLRRWPRNGDFDENLKLFQNIKWSASSKLVLTASSHYMSFVTLTVHLSVVAAVITAS